MGFSVQTIHLRLFGAAILILAAGAVLVAGSLFILDIPGVVRGAVLIAGGSLIVYLRRYEGRRLAGLAVGAFAFIGASLYLLSFLPTPQ